MTDRMRELFEAVVQDPDNNDASVELERLLHDEADWSSLANLYVHLAEHAGDPAAQSKAYRQAADVAESRQDDARRAVELYGASLEGEPGDGRATLGRMRSLLIGLEDWDAYLQVANAEVERIPDEEVPARAMLIYQMGEVLEEKQGNQEDAMRCYQGAFQQDPGCLQALYAARRIYRQLNNWEMVARLLDIELQSVETDERRAEILQDLGNVLLYDLEQPELAKGCFEQLVALRPDDEDSRAILAELGGEPAPTAFEDAEATAADVEALPEVDTEIPQPEEVSEPEMATEAEAEPEPEPEEAAVEAEPEPEPEPEMAAEAEPEPEPEEAADEPEPAPEVEEAAVEPEPVPEEAAVEPEPAPVPEEAVDEPVPEEVVEAPEVVAEPEPPPATPEEVAERVTAIEAEAAELEGPDRAAALTRAVAMLSTAGGGGDIARLYLDAVKADPANVVIYSEAGVSLQAPEAALNTIADGLDALVAEEYAGQTNALTAHRLIFGAQHLDQTKTVDFKLREMVRKAGDPAVIPWQIERLVATNKWRNVQQLLVDQHGGDPAESRLHALRGMARLAERAGEDGKAADFWRQVHQADNSDREARGALLRLYEATEKWNQYVDVLRMQVDDIPDDDVEARIDGLRKLVATYTAHLKQDAMVVKLYNNILELDPDDADATDALAAKYESMRRWPDLVGLLQRKAERTGGEDLTALRVRIADLFLKKLRNQAEAIKAFEAVLEADPDHREAISALDGMYEKRRDWDKLVAVRRQVADLHEEPADRIAAYKDLAAYATKKIRRPAICLELWEQVIEIEPDDTDALRALVGFYEQDKNWAALTEATDRLVDLTDDDKEKVDLLQKSGVVLQDRVGDKAAAVPVWKRLLDIDPGHRRAGDALKKALIELGDWDALSDFFAAHEKWDELVRVLEGQVGVQKDDAIRIDLLFRSASIWEERLGNQDRAVRALERVLQLEPQNLAGARALEPIYDEHDDYRKLANVLEVLLEHEDAPAERRTLMLRSAAINEQHLRNPEGAFEWCRRVVTEHPADAGARAELERLGGMTHQWATVHDDLVSALANVDGYLPADPTDAAAPEPQIVREPITDEETGEPLYDDETGEPLYREVVVEAEAAPAPEPADYDPSAARLELLLSLASILDEQMGANEDALTRYHDALDIDPDNLAALDAVCAIYTRMMNWPELLKVLDRKLALVDSVEQRKELLRQQGVIYEEQLEDSYAAIERYRAIIEEEANDKDALQALHRLYESGESWEDLHEVLQRELQLAAIDGAEGVGVLGIKMQIGQIELVYLGRTADAIANFRDVLEAEPEHAEARGALEGLLEDPEYRADVAHILEPIYRDAREWEALVVTLEIQLEETEEAERRIELLERVGTLHVDRTADIERAFDAFARMLREQPDNRVAIQRLVELADAGDRWSPLAALLEQVLPDITDDRLAESLLTRLADIYEERTGEVEQAIDAHRRVLDREPDHRASIEALDRLYQRSQQWPELLAIYRRKLELSEDADAREALQFQIAQLLEDMLGDAAEAIAVYGEILENAPESMRALQSVSRLYEQEALWAELADSLERQLALTEDGAERIALQVRLGGLHQRDLGNAEIAIRTYQAVLDADPANVEAREALERLIEDVDYRNQIADILEPIYQLHDEWRQLVGIYEIQRDFSDEPARQVELLHRIARLHQERGGDVEQAFHSYARAFEVQPGDAATLRMLHEIAESLGLWAELVGVYEAQVDLIDDLPAQTDIHKRTARIQREHLNDIEGAARHFVAAYQADDADLEVIGALDEIYSQTGHFNELVAVLLRHAELTEEAEPKKDLLFRVCALYEEMLEDQERAVDILQMVLEVDPVDARALDTLERIYLHLERYEDLMEVLHRKAELTQDTNARKDIYYVIGAAYERELDDLLRAVETYKTILEWDEVDATALQSLDRLYVRLEQWEDLLGILAREVEISDEADAQLALRFRMAQLHEVHLEQVGTAIEGYAGILADMASHEPTLQATEALVREDREAELAAAVLEPVLTEGGAWQRMIAVWSDLLEVTTDLERRTALRLQIGRAYEDMLLEGEQAFAAYGQAFAEDPTHEATLASLERVARASEGWDLLVRLIEEQLYNISSDYVARDLYLRVARVFEEEISSNVDAIERYRRVLEFDPDHDGAIGALDRLYEKEGMWADLADILRLCVERAEEEEQVRQLIRLGTLYETALDQIGEAIAAYKEVLGVTPQQPEAVQALERLFEAGHEQPTIGEVLEPLYTTNESWSQLHSLLESLLAHQEPGEDRMRAMHRLAEISQGRLEDTDRAFDWYGRAFGEVPEDEHSRAEVARLAAETGRFADLVAIYHAGLQNTHDTELIRSIAHEMATVHRQQLGDDAAAEQMYRYILDGIDPADTAALKGTDELLLAQQRWDELVDILKREIGATYDEVELLGFMFRLGQVYENQLGDVPLATEQYRGILDQEPHHDGALARLRDIYLAQQEWEPLYDIYSRQAEIAEPHGEKADLKAQMANIASEFLQRPMDAVDLWNDVLELRGEDPPALMALEALHQEQESWRELVDVCERQVNLLDNDAAREIELYAKLGRVWGDYLERERNAIENWHKVIDRDPESVEAHSALRELHERAGELAEVAATNHRLLELLGPDHDQRVELYRQLGNIYQEALDKPSDAIEAWTHVLALQTHDADAIESLEELYTNAEDWAAMVEVLDRKVEITEDPYDRVSILFRIAETNEEQLGDAASAQSAYQRVLEVQPDNIDAFQQLERLYEAGEQHMELVELLLTRVGHTQDTYEQQELFGRMAITFEQKLESPENAFEVLGQAFEASRDDERYGDELERLAGVTGQWSELIGRYQAVLQILGEVPESVALHMRVARWYDEKADEPKHAATHYQYVRALEPDNVAAVTALELLLERYDNWPQVVQLLREKVDLAVDPDERMASLVKMAGILESKMDSPEEAIEAYRQVVLIDNTHLDSLKALERLYAQTQRWQDLIEALDAQTMVLDDEALIVENHLRVGELWEGRMGAPDRAIESYRQALAVDDRCTDAMDALKKLYTLQDRWHDLLDVYEMMLTVKPAAEDQAKVYGRIAMIQEEELSDVHATMDTYRKMLLVQPTDTAAVRALDRLYRDQERWDDLADTYMQFLEAVEDEASKTDARLTLAQVFEGELNDPYRAIEALAPIIEIDENHRESLARLGRLYVQTEDWESAIDVLARETHLLTDRSELLERQHRVGTIFAEKIGDLDQAERWFRGALEHDPNYLPALTSLKTIYEQRAEWHEVVRTLKMMEAATRSFEEKSRHLQQMGTVYESYLEDRNAAIDYFEQAMDLFPENADAAEPLVEVYWADSRWERAEPLLDLLIQARADGELRDLQALNYRCGHCAEQLRKDDKALTHYRQAYELDSTHLPTLRGMGGLLFRREDWDRAFKIYQTILVHHRESLEEAEIVEIFHRQGAIKLKVGERRKALDFFRKALELEGQHTETLHAIVELHESQGDWDEVIHYRRQLQGLLTDPGEQFQGLVTIGDILHEQMRNDKLAVESFNEALAAQPGSKLVLSKLLGIHEEAGNWAEAVEVLVQLAELEQDSGRQAKYYYAVAAIQRDYLKDGFTAVRSFDKALDADPSMLKAFQAIDQILTNERDYARQDRYYRKMLKRATEHQLEDKLVVMLAKSLGEINRTRLQKYDESIKAYKIALSKKPDDGATLQIMAELYELENRADKAIAQHYRLIELNPANVESYQNLRRLFMESGRYDEAWCVCQVLSFMGKANADERAFFEKYRSRTLTQARSPLDNQHWALVYHPEKSALLDQLFKNLYKFVLPEWTRTKHGDVGVHKRKDFINPEDQIPFNNVLNYAAQITRLRRHDTYKASQGQTGVRAAALNPPALLVGADMLSGRNMQQLAFVCAKQLFLSNGYFLATLDDSYEHRKYRLITLVYSLMKTVNANAEVPNADQGLIDQVLSRIPAPDLNEMTKLIQKMSANPAQHLNVSKWLEMVEHSSNRLGLLLCNDVGSAIEAIKNEQRQFSKAPTQERIREVILFALSENYFQLRKALGLAIG